MAGSVYDRIKYIVCRTKNIIQDGIYSYYIYSNGVRG